MGKQKDINSKNNSPCGKCGVPCQCSSSGPKNTNCQCCPQKPEQTPYPCGCSPPEPQPEPEPKIQKEACECGCSPSQPQPKLPIGACTCGCSSPEPQPRQRSKDCACDSSLLQLHPQPKKKRRNEGCACDISPFQLQPQPKQQSEDCACYISPPQPQPKSRRQSGACACGCSPQQQQPKSKRQCGACDSRPPQAPPPEPVRIPCSPEIISGSPRQVYCQCNRSGQSQPIQRACGSSAPQQPLDYCQCNQYGNPEKKERVPTLETYVCYQPRPQPEVQSNSPVNPIVKCMCNAPNSSPFPKPKESYGLASVKSSPEPIDHQRQVPKKNQHPQPTCGKGKKKSVRFNR